MPDRVRVHVGNSTVYLKNWINVDLEKSGCALAKDSPAGVAKWGTDESNYYGQLTHIDAAYLGAHSPDHESIVTDLYGSWAALPFDDTSVDELWSVQCWEHLSRTEAMSAAIEARRVLKIGGTLTLDVPDHEATILKHAQMRRECETELNNHIKIAKKRDADFMLRHMFGSRKNHFGFHMGSWTRNQLVQFLEPYGFKPIRDNDNLHFYPAFSVTFEKTATSYFPELDVPLQAWQAAHQYCGEDGGPLKAPEDADFILEVGPGTAPWSAATHYCDIVPRELPNFKIGDVQNLPYPNDDFDYSFVSHCLEHVADPVKAAEELNRVSRAGCIVSPHPMKEGLLLAHEQDHRWWVLAGKDRLFFKKIPEGLYAKIWDNGECSGQMHRIMRYGDPRLEGMCSKMKRHFHNIEPLIDTIYHWKDSLRVEIIE